MNTAMEHFDPNESPPGAEDPSLSLIETEAPTGVFFNLEEENKGESEAENELEKRYARLADLAQRCDTGETLVIEVMNEMGLISPTDKPQWEQKEQKVREAAARYKSEYFIDGISIDVEKLGDLYDATDRYADNPLLETILELKKHIPKSRRDARGQTETSTVEAITIEAERITRFLILRGTHF